MLQCLHQLRHLVWVLLPNLQGVTVIVPGYTEWLAAKRDPYQDLVYLAKDLGVWGVDLDYEEMWHADVFKVNLTITLTKR